LSNLNIWTIQVTVQEKQALSVSPEPVSLKPTLQTVQTAILRTVAYADLFDYPLTLDQVHRYLVDVTALPSAVYSALHSEWLVPRRLTCAHGFYCLAGREAIIQTRLRRAEISARLWPKARRYGRSIASLPFVRMVAITGTLAVNNVETDADVDYLVVTIPRRVWLARSLVIALVHRGRLEGVEICPNYVISTEALDQFDRSFFSAHELAQMVPLYGLDVYDRLIYTNRWAGAYLPNAFASDTWPQRQAGRPTISRTRQMLKQSGERILQDRLGDLWEQRERSRKISQLSAEAACLNAGAATFTPQRCKGHMDDHGNHIQRAYAQRLKRLGLDTPELLEHPSAPASRKTTKKEL
jgi:hypothetical protein